MTNEFSYKVTLQAPCGAKRFAAFHMWRKLDLDEAQAEGPRHVTSQTCPRCEENHRQEDFIAINVQQATVH